jgi:pyrrolidone-carboxylate peptidase
MDLRISEDPGRYLCDFIYYSSLAHLYKADRRRNVVFLHVPSDASDAYVTQGRELALNLIRALVESETAAQREQV